MKDRRLFLRRSAAVVSGAATASLVSRASAEPPAGEPWERVYGTGFTRYGQPSRFEQPVGRHFGQPYG
ncbi:MAG TPA: hypothetical protein VEV21_08535, partial [Burkholderiales bacterium]|nr:hypothetical protein [Burkholderiales bacterium]